MLDAPHVTRDPINDVAPNLDPAVQEIAQEMVIAERSRTTFRNWRELIPEVSASW
jgi:hypothetical protein